MSLSAVSGTENIWLNLLNQQTKKIAPKDAATITDSTTSTDAASKTQSVSEVDFASMITASMDTDGDGKISTEEYQTGMKDAQSLLASLDTQKSQMNAYQLQNTSEDGETVSPPPPPPESATASFSNFDTDSDGAISEEEFTAALQTLGAQSLAKQQQAATTATTDTAATAEESSMFDKFSIPGMMGGMGSLMAFTGQGQGNMPAYNMLMDQLLQRQ